MKVDNFLFNIFERNNKNKWKQMKLQTCLFQFQYSTCNFSEMILKMMLTKGSWINLKVCTYVLYCMF